MKSIILVAGLGTRMRPHTFTTAKPLLPVAGYPTLKYILDMLAAIPAMDEFVFVVGHLGDQIETWVKANYKMPAHFFVQRELNGQAPAVALTRESVRGAALVLFGDGILDADFAGLSDFRDDAIAFVQAVADPSRLGVALVENGLITKFVEKSPTPVSKLALAGMYFVREMPQMYAAIDEQIAKNIRTKGEFYLADTFNVMLAQGARMCAREIKTWVDAGTIESWIECNRLMLERNGSREIPTTASQIIPPVFIGDGARIVNSTIGPFVSISENAVIENSRVSNSIVFAGAQIRDCELRESIIGEQANVRGARGKLNVGKSSIVQVND
ncbi:MAG: NTP transferase domain-containing protein [Chloroflexi bacterium]|nr:NTP transferase domain-containing protein [Chloroflexota bacterium]